MKGRPEVFSSRGRVFEPFTYSGVVTAPSTLVETETVVQGNRHGVSSHTNHYQTERFFLRLPEGTDKPMSFTNLDVRVAPGHFFSGMDIKGPDGSVWGLLYYNHNTQEHYIIPETVKEIVRVHIRGMFFIMGMILLFPVLFTAGISAVLPGSIGLFGKHPFLDNIGLVILLIILTFVVFSLIAKNAQTARRLRLMAGWVTPVLSTFRAHQPLPARTP